MNILDTIDTSIIKKMHENLLQENKTVFNHDGVFLEMVDENESPVGRLEHHLSKWKSIGADNNI